MEYGCIWCSVDRYSCVILPLSFGKNPQGSTQVFFSIIRDFFLLLQLEFKYLLFIISTPNFKLFSISLSKANKCRTFGVSTFPIYFRIKAWERFQILLKVYNRTHSVEMKLQYKNNNKITVHALTTPIFCISYPELQQNLGAFQIQTKQNVSIQKPPSFPVFSSLKVNVFGHL